MTSASPEAAFLGALPVEARAAFADTAALATTLAAMRDTARGAYPDLTVADDTFASELARRLGDAATPERLARTRADHVYLAIACMAGSDAAIKIVEKEFLDVVDACARRLN